MKKLGLIFPKRIHFFLNTGLLITCKRMYLYALCIKCNAVLIKKNEIFIFYKFVHISKKVSPPKVKKYRNVSTQFNICIP